MYINQCLQNSKINQGLPTDQASLKENNMKHLKHFESIESNGYTEIYDVEFSDFIEEDRLVDTSYDEYRKIESWIEEYGSDYQVDEAQYYNLVTYIDIFDDGIIAKIWKIIDEWFVIYDDHTGIYYKCDRLDGVFNCLEQRVL